MSGPYHRGTWGENDHRWAAWQVGDRRTNADLHRSRDGSATRALFMIPSGTFGDSPESLPCEVIGGAVEVGQTRWQDGTVEYEGASYAGVIGEATFSIPQLAVDTYWLAESIAARGTGCHIFMLIEVVAGLPDMAIPQADTTSGQAVPLGATVLAVSLLLLPELTGRAVSRPRH